MTHVRTSLYYPQSNGKQERWHGTLKRECIRPHVPLSLDDARRIVAQFVEHDNSTRLHSAIGYVAPLDKLLGLEQVIAADRDHKLEAARERRRLARQAARAWAALQKLPLVDAARQLRDRLAPHLAPPLGRFRLSCRILVQQNGDRHETGTSPTRSQSASWWSLRFASR